MESCIRPQKRHAAPRSNNGRIVLRYVLLCYRREVGRKASSRCFPTEKRGRFNATQVKVMWHGNRAQKGGRQVWGTRHRHPGRTAHGGAGSGGGVRRVQVGNGQACVRVREGVCVWWVRWGWAVACRVGASGKACSTRFSQRSCTANWAAAGPVKVQKAGVRM